MKILIPTGAFPPEIGGPATYVPRLAKALVEKGHNVTIMTFTQADGYDDSQFNFKLIRLPKKGRLDRWINTVWQLMRQLRQHDVAYVNGLLMETAVATLFVIRPMVAKVVGDIAWERARDKGWTSHTIDFFQTRVYDIPIEARRAMRDWALHRMKYVIVPSQYLRSIVSKWFVDPRLIKLIYNAYEPPLDQPSAVDFPPKKGHRLITVCRLVNWKGVDGILKTVQNTPNCDLLVVGDGPEKENLEKLSRNLKIQNRVHFLGSLSHASVIEALKTADLFMLNSVYEGLPHVLLEALAVGLPIVATEIGGTPEVVLHGVNGRLTPINNLEKLTESTHTALKNRLTYQVELTDKFKLETMIEQTTDLLIEAGIKH
ncbi:MAG: glycosyltransferase family 4 protein [Chloroflexota bacterium]